MSDKLNDLYNDLNLLSRSTADGPYIRLLTLKAGQAKEPIECSLEVFSLQSLPEYEALSYCWGDARKKRLIHCNHKRFQVTTNLYSCLLHIRKQDGDLVIWIDAVCINQDDMAEREQQVGIMNEIYSRAHEVLVWLGPGNKATDLGIRACKDVIKSLEGFLLLTGGNLEAIAVADPFRGFQPRNLTNQELDALCAILRRAWWSRVWIIQELCLARNAKVIIGQSSMEWAQFNVATFILQTHNAQSRDLDSQSYLALLMMKGEQPPRPRPLEELLGNFRWFQATDPRDKVYGLLGLSSNSKILTPNYKISVDESYIQTTFAIMKDTGSLDIMDQCQTPNFVEKRSLPSWVPDWSYDASSLPKRRLNVSEDTLYLKTYLATRFKQTTSGPFHTASHSSKCIPHFKPGNILVLRGFLVDRIQDLKSPVHISHLPVGPSNARGMQTPTPSASPAQLIAVLKNMAWVLLTNPSFWIMPNINIYRIGIFLTLMLDCWKFAIPRRGFTEDIALKRMLRVFSKDAMDSDQISKVITFLVAYREQVEGASILLRCFRYYGLDLLLPSVYTWALGLTGSSLGPTVLYEIIALQLFAMESRFGKTTAGRLVHVPWNTQPGDQIALFQGGKTPFVIRPIEERWQLIGSSYVQGLMSGEGWEEERCMPMEFV